MVDVYGFKFPAFWGNGLLINEEFIYVSLILFFSK